MKNSHEHSGCCGHENHKHESEDCCSNNKESIKDIDLAHQKNDHEHEGCCGHDHNHEKDHTEHDHQGCCGHSHHSDEECGGHDHSHEGGCCGHDHSVDDIKDTIDETSATISHEYTMKEYTIKGIHCGSCANKIEEKISKLSTVNRVVMNFATSTLTMEIKKDKVEDTLKEAKNIANQVEPGTTIEPKGRKKLKSELAAEAKEEDGSIKKKLYRIGAGIGIFLAALYFKEKSFALYLFIISYFAIGKEIITKSVKNILRGELFDENFLMTIATVAAFGIGEYPEAIMVVLLFEIGEYFQDRAVESSRKSIADLMDIRPDYANINKGEDTLKVSPFDVKLGEIIVVKPGEKVPLDGVVISGSSSLDTSALTGESALRYAGEGDNVTSGFINIDGVLTIKVTKEFKDSAVSKILDLVENASGKKAKTEKRITKFAKYYTPFVVVSALMTAMLPPLLMEGESFETWVYKAAIFLVISCPCALVISVPMGYFAGLGASSKNGILVKGSNYLEALTEIDTVVFDKTGTLTKGNFKVSNISSKKNITKEDLLKYTAHVESFSNHPIALSIIKEYGRSIDKNLITDYKDVSGKGVMANVDGIKVASGNDKLMKQLNIKHDKVTELGTIIYTAIDNKYAGYIVIEDEIKKDAQKAVIDLKSKNIQQVVMLTGDKKEVAESVGKDLKIDKIYSELLPQDKVEKVEELYKENIKGLVFVGDGINDAPVLARANVGVAMGGVGSDAAIEAADVVIMNDEPSKLATAISIAKRTKEIVNMNIIMSVGIKLIVFALAFVDIASMWMAIFADVGVSTLAVMNSMRVLKAK